MPTNRRDLRIVWGGRNPAGIVFSPRYFEMFDASTTAPFERALGMSTFEFLKAYDALLSDGRHPPSLSGTGEPIASARRAGIIRPPTQNSGAARPRRRRCTGMGRSGLASVLLGLSG